MPLSHKPLSTASIALSESVGGVIMIKGFENQYLSHVMSIFLPSEDTTIRGGLHLYHVLYVAMNVNAVFVYAIAGMKPLQHLLFPRPRGMQIALRHLAGNLDTVYDTTIAYSNTYDSENNIRIESPSFFGNTW